jgi:hypothetical protein
MAVTMTARRWVRQRATVERLVLLDQGVAGEHLGDDFRTVSPAAKDHHAGRQRGRRERRRPALTPTPRRRAQSAWTALLVSTVQGDGER